MASRSAFLLLCVSMLHGPSLDALPLRPAEDPPPRSVEPIPQAEDAFLEKDVQAEANAWMRRCLLPPARERWEGKAWAAEAAALMEEVLDTLRAEFMEPHPLAACAERFRRLRESVADDPLINLMAARAFFDASRDWRSSRDLLKETADHPQAGSAIESLALAARKRQLHLEGLKEDLLDERMAQVMLRSVTDGTYEEAEVNVFTRHAVVLVRATELGRAPLAQLQDEVMRSAWPEWSRLAVSGSIEVTLAWVERGSGWADSVTEEGWKGFARHLKNARDQLGKSHRLRPDRPEAASRMITVCMGENVDFSELRAWFDKAVSAQFDYEPAYAALLSAAKPRWLGSHELMLALGRACVETGRFDTLVPSRLMTAALDVAEEVGEARAVFRHDSVRESMLAMSRGYLDAVGATPGARHLRVSNAAMAAWLADDDELARKALNEAGPSLHEVTRKYLHDQYLHESVLRTGVAAGAGAFGEALREVANLPLGTDALTYLRALEAVDPAPLSGEAKAYREEMLDLLRLPERVSKGGWVDIQPRKGLNSFYQTGGLWSVEDDGTLVAEGDDQTWTRLILRIPLKEDLEFRGEYEFEIPEGIEYSAGGLGFGAGLRWLPHGASGVKFMVHHHNNRAPCTQAYCGIASKGAPDRVLKPRTKHTFSARVADGKISYDLDGQRIHTAYPLERMGMENEWGMPCLVAYHLPVGARVRVRHLQLRKITAADLAPAVTAKTTGAPVAATPAEAASAGKYKLQLAVLAALLVAAFFVNRRLNPRVE